MTPRAVALYRERAELQRQLARVDAALADEAEGAANDTVTELDPRPRLPRRREAAVSAPDLFWHCLHCGAHDPVEPTGGPEEGARA